MRRKVVDPTSGLEWELAARLTEGPPLILDGATGTELERRGVWTGLPLWSAHALVDSPDTVEAIHLDYARAGVEILTANTFRTQRRALAHGGLAERAGELTELAVALARRALHRAGAATSALVAGSAPTLEDCYRPDRVPDDASLRREHAEHAANLARAGVDLILVETMNTRREALAALRAAREVGRPALVSFVCGAGAALLSGEALADAVAAVADEGPLCVLVNCLPPSKVPPCLEVLRDAGLPFGVYANLGEPRADGSLDFTEACSPQAFADAVESWVAAGAHMVGGCCGTTPAHLEAVVSRRGRRGVGGAFLGH